MSTRAIAKAPMITADVGVIKFTQPDAAWKAVTIQLI